MPDARSAKTRARDIDRAQTCSLLDAAYADGQLSAEEHESRTATAMHATTLGALSALTKDLQIPDHLLDAATASEDPAGHPHRRRRGLVVAVTAVVAMIVAALARVLFGGGH
ncbi:DUF1707 SHOCT-like domain-containing protein [Rhodococcus sp. W8901]|uniref:DUF1707 SHOCT-like domain-containing protein n=1 Tax=Rhodococcus sp. W8901 TaxID=2742603 RepID=UPI0015818190|nr:DUF1707 domain-containing protein [Rhodococcus sp. W8901]QKT11532.1 DUF1707 domain-containing protein [Rhodococcus sp. W8901]